MQLITAAESAERTQSIWFFHLHTVYLTVMSLGTHSHIKWILIPAIQLVNYLAFDATYLPIILPKSFQSHTAKCLLIDSSSSQPINIAVAMETQPTQWPIAIILGLNNWTEWIRSIQYCVETLGIWKYIDPVKTEELWDLSYPEPKNIKPMATRYSDLSEDEKEELKEQHTLYRQYYEIIRMARLSINKVSIIIK